MIVIAVLGTVSASELQTLVTASPLRTRKKRLYSEQHKAKTCFVFKRECTELLNEIVLFHYYTAQFYTTMKEAVGLEKNGTEYNSDKNKKKEEERETDGDKDKIHLESVRESTH